MPPTTWPVPRLRNRECPQCQGGNLNLEHWRTETETDVRQTVPQLKYFAVFRCYLHPTSHPAQRQEFNPRQDPLLL